MPLCYYKLQQKVDNTLLFVHSHFIILKLIIKHNIDDFSTLLTYFVELFYIFFFPASNAHFTDFFEKFFEVLEIGFIQNVVEIGTHFYHVLLLNIEQIGLISYFSGNRNYFGGVILIIHLNGLRTISQLRQFRQVSLPILSTLPIFPHFLLSWIPSD